MVPADLADSRPQLMLLTAIILMMIGGFAISLFKFRDIAARVGLCLILALPVIDCLSSLVLPNPAPKMIMADGRDGSPELLIVIPGYNGYGSCLLKALEPQVNDRFAIAALQPSSGKYDLDEVTRLVHKTIRENKFPKITIYAESMGGMVVAELLRRYPDLKVDRLILNAAPAAPTDTKDFGMLNTLHRWPAGVLSTGIMQINQRFDDGGPSPEPGMNPAVKAYCNKMATNTTGPRAFSEMDVIANFKAVKPGELIGRVDNLTYMRAPEPADSMIKLDNAVPQWKDAIGANNFTETKVQLWSGGIHCGTPSRPSPIITAINSTYEKPRAQ